MTTIIMTTVINDKLGRYTRFSEKGANRLLGSVDRKDGKYHAFIGRVFPTLIGTRSSKDAAIALAQKRIREMIPDAEFKWNVMQERIKRC